MAKLVTVRPKRGNMQFVRKPDIGPNETAVQRVKRANANTAGYSIAGYCKANGLTSPRWVFDPGMPYTMFREYLDTILRDIKPYQPLDEFRAANRALGQRRWYVWHKSGSNPVRLAHVGIVHGKTVQDAIKAARERFPHFIGKMKIEDMGLYQLSEKIDSPVFTTSKPIPAAGAKQLRGSIGPIRLSPKPPHKPLTRQQQSAKAINPRVKFLPRKGGK